MNKILPLHRFNYAEAAATTLPFNCIGLSSITPTVRLLLPSRIVTHNYVDTAVYTANVPISSWHIDASILTGMSIADAIRVTDDVTVLSSVADLPCLIYYVSTSAIQLYRNINSSWSLVGSTLPLTIDYSIIEERVLPVCLTSPATLAYEMVLDCRENGQIADGCILRISHTELRIPLIMLPGLQVGTLDISSLSLLDINSVERFFVTDNLVTDMFPTSATGKHIIFHLFSNGSQSQCVIYYGENFTQASPPLTFSSISSRVLPVVESNAYTGSTTFNLAVTGGLNETSQYALETRPFFYSRSDGVLSIDFTLTVNEVTVSANTPNNPVVGTNPYMVIALHDTTISTHSEYPGLPSTVSAINLVLDFTRETVYITTTNGDAINTCSGGCELANTDMQGDWSLKLFPIESGSYVAIYQNEVYIDSIYVSMFSINNIHIPRNVTWYINSSNVPFDVDVEIAPTMNRVPYIIEQNMCAAASLAGTLTPCMSTSALVLEIDTHGSVTVDGSPIGPIANQSTLLSGTTDSIWKVSNNTSPCQVTTTNILSTGDKSFFLTSRSFITVTSDPTITVDENSTSFRWFMRFNQILNGDIFALETIPSLPTNPVLSIVIRIVSGKWEVSSRSRSQDTDNLTTITYHSHTAPDIQANTLYCMGITISSTSIILYVNGIAYPCAESNVNSGIRLFNPDTVPRNKLTATLTAPMDCFFDDMLVGWGVEWVGAEMFALNNDAISRSVLVNCDYTQLTTDTSKQPVTLPIIASTYGGVVKAVKVTSIYVDSTSIVHIFSLVSQFGSALVDITFTAADPVTLSLLYGSQEANLYEEVNVNLTTVVRGIRISRGMGLYVKTDTPVTARIVALYL